MFHWQNFPIILCVAPHLRLRRNAAARAAVLVRLLAAQERVQKPKVSKKYQTFWSHTELRKTGERLLQGPSEEATMACQPFKEHLEGSTVQEHLSCGAREPPALAL